MCWSDAFLNIPLQKKHFYQELRDLGTFYFVSSTGNLEPPRAKSLQNGDLSFFPSQQKIKPVTTHKMASHLMDMNTIFQENMCFTDSNHCKHSKMIIFLTTVHFNTGNHRHFFGSVHSLTYRLVSKTILSMTLNCNCNGRNTFFFPRYLLLWCNVMMILNGNKHLWDKPFLGNNRFLNNMILKVSTAVLCEIVISDTANSGVQSPVETHPCFTMADIWGSQ